MVNIPMKPKGFPKPKPGAIKGSAPAMPKVPLPKMPKGSPKPKPRNIRGG